jgi:hypothetical protein
METILESTLTTSLRYFDKKQYLLINLCSKDTDYESIGLVLNAGTFSLRQAENSPADIQEMKIMEAYSMMSSDEFYPFDLTFHTQMAISGSSLSIPLAYACPHDIKPSLKLSNIANLATTKSTDTLDIASSKDLADLYIAFTETGYVLTCETENNEEFEYTLYLNRDAESGVLERFKITNGRELFDKQLNSAIERVKEAAASKERLENAESSPHDPSYFGNCY